MRSTHELQRATIISVQSNVYYTEGPLWTKGERSAHWPWPRACAHCAAVRIVAHKQLPVECASAGRKALAGRRKGVSGARWRGRTALAAARPPASPFSPRAASRSRPHCAPCVDERRVSLRCTAKCCLSRERIKGRFPLLLLPFRPPPAASRQGARGPWSRGQLAHRLSSAGAFTRGASAQPRSSGMPGLSRSSPCPCRQATSTREGVGAQGRRETPLRFPRHKRGALLMGAARTHGRGGAAVRRGSKARAQGARGKASLRGRMPQRGTLRASERHHGAR